jgi:hypothetical protein
MVPIVPAAAGAGFLFANTLHAVDRHAVFRREASTPRLHAAVGQGSTAVV